MYYLVSGRWFSSPGFTGPWTFASLTLPEDFQKIPLEHPRSRVLAAVPGTQQAAEAVLLAQVPQTARINKKEIKAPDVAYQGDPKFEPVPPTQVSYATNTDKDIVKFGDLYYMCFQGVWFMSKKPTGPWEVCTNDPQGDLRDPGQLAGAQRHLRHRARRRRATTGRRSRWWRGYTGLMIAWGCAVWGTGYYHPPYWGWGGYYPYYYPRYPSYGYGAWYNPWTGAYGRSAVAYGPYGGAGVPSRYNPRTGTYSRGAAAWGPTARAATARPTTRAPAPTARRGRGRTSTAVGAARRCSAATTGRGPRASPTTGRARRRASRRALAAAAR